jgi:hypothetical protein
VNDPTGIARCDKCGEDFMFWTRGAGEEDIFFKVQKAIGKVVCPDCLSSYGQPITMDYLLMLAWGLIANAGGGNWDNETPEWRKEAQRWRDDFHRRLQAERPSTPTDSPPQESPK